MKKKSNTNKEKAKRAALKDMKKEHVNSLFLKKEILLTGLITFIQF
jgi:hypothetical protein